MRPPAPVMMMFLAIVGRDGEGVFGSVLLPLSRS